MKRFARLCTCCVAVSHWAAQRCSTATSSQLTAPRLRALIWLQIALLWLPVVAIGVAIPERTWATGVTDGLEVPLLLACVSMLLSTFAGVTALLTRIERELSAAPDRPLPHPWLLSLSHMAGSWLAGVIAFIVNQATQFNVWAGLSLVIAASFTGAKFVEAWAERMSAARSAMSSGSM